MIDVSIPHPFLGDETTSRLEREGLLSPAVNNKRNLSATVLYSSSSSSSSSSVSVSSTSAVFTAAAVSHPVDTITIPDRLSIEAYEYMGFKQSVAKELWSNFVDLASEWECPFEEFAYMRIEDSGLDVTGGNEDWNGCLDGIGINQELKDAIMMPEFADIRCTGTAKMWVREVVQERFEFLQHLEDEARHTLALRQRSQKGGRPKSGSISETPSAPSPRSKKERASIGSSSASTLTFAGSGAQSATKEDSEPQPVVSDVEISKTLPGHTIIWRASYKNATLAMEDRQSGSIRLELISTAPGDFSGRKKVAYFTPQKEVAHKFAQWAKHKAKDQEVFITRVFIPDAMLNELSSGTTYLWFEDRSRPKDEWKRVVCLSRQAYNLDEDLSWIARKDLLIGNMVKGVNQKFNNMPKSDYPKLTIEDVLHVKIDGYSKEAIQWVFQSSKAQRAFSNHCGDKITFFSLGTYFAPKSEEEVAAYKQG